MGNFDGGSQEGHEQKVNLVDELGCLCKMDDNRCCGLVGCLVADLQFLLGW